MKSRRPRMAARLGGSFRRATFPFVISDWMMPEMDGPDLVRLIRACERPGYVYVILLTAKSQKDDVVLGMEAGADDFVTKPFDHEELRVRLRRASGSCVWNTRWPSRIRRCAKRRPPWSRTRSWPAWGGWRRAWRTRSTIPSPTSAIT